MISVSLLNITKLSAIFLVLDDSHREIRAGGQDTKCKHQNPWEIFGVNMSPDFDNHLLKYFTDVEHLQKVFRDCITSASLPKRMMVVHGVGGVGKSSLLSMFRIHCKKEKVAVGFASGDEDKSVFAIVIEELKPMTVDVMRMLIQRYYATMRGSTPDPAQVDAIIRFARGLPMVVTSAVQLWVQYGVEDFQSVRAEIVANLVDRLMEGVSKPLIPVLEAAAIVRWFDQPILRALTGMEDVQEVYNELRRFPFVRTRVEGFALHDSVRELIDENLRVQDAERHAKLHERAAQHFDEKLEKSASETDRLELESLYHHIRADKNKGLILFQAIAERLSLPRLSNRLQILINDVKTYGHADERKTSSSNLRMIMDS